MGWYYRIDLDTNVKHRTDQLNFLADLAEASLTTYMYGHGLRLSEWERDLVLLNGKRGKSPMIERQLTALVQVKHYQQAVFLALGSRKVLFGRPRVARVGW